MIPLINHDSRLRENSEVVIIYPYIYIYIPQVVAFSLANKNTQLSSKPKKCNQLSSFANQSCEGIHLPPYSSTSNGKRIISVILLLRSFSFSCSFPKMGDNPWKTLHIQKIILVLPFKMMPRPLRNFQLGECTKKKTWMDCPWTERAMILSFCDSKLGTLW